MAQGLAEHFSGDHRRCDALWGEVEAAVDKGDTASIAAAWSRFDRAMRRHYSMEEEVLFPAFEAATGMANAGPTHVMRSEHVQMRAVLDQMAAAAEREDHRELVDQGDTLLMLIQQHNTKEEGMLYPMAERALGGQWPELLQRLASYEEPE
jgi:hemerythrin-like domain-containing protein